MEKPTADNLMENATIDRCDHAGHDGQYQVSIPYNGQITSLCVQAKTETDAFTQVKKRLERGLETGDFS